MLSFGFGFRICFILRWLYFFDSFITVFNFGFIVLFRNGYFFVMPVVLARAPIFYDPPAFEFVFNTKFILQSGDVFIILAALSFRKDSDSPFFADVLG